MTICLTKNELKRLEHCKKTGLDIWKGRNEPPSSQIYFVWCRANNRPHILVKYRQKYAYVSMDLPTISGWPGPDSIYTEQFHELCGRFDVPWIGALSVLDLPKKDVKPFCKELLRIGQAFCSGLRPQIAPQTPHAAELGGTAYPDSIAPPRSTPSLPPSPSFLPRKTYEP
jgi:hypothetical protein